MEIQSLSICVPAGCPNNCHFCVSRLHANDYPNRTGHRADVDFMNRLEYARDNGVPCAILTGTGEPITNMKFINFFAGVNRSLDRPFRHIELQTSGVTLSTGKLEELRDLGIQTISLSLSSLISDENALYNRTPVKWQFEIAELCHQIKSCGFNLRLSLNMTDAFCGFPPKSIFNIAKSKFKADQVTFRILYQSPGRDLPQDKWIDEHRAPDKVTTAIDNYILAMGTPLHRLSFGAMKYDVDGISTVVDSDCMNTEAKDTLKYLILREDCRLYTHWDKKGSLVY